MAKRKKNETVAELAARIRESIKLPEGDDGDDVQCLVWHSDLTRLLDSVGPSSPPVAASTPKATPK